MNEIDKIKAELTKAKEKIEELTKFEQRAKYHEEKCVKLMKVVDYFLDTKTDKVPPNFKQDVSEALYDKYADMIEEKAEQLAEMMVEDRMKSGEGEKMICQSEKEIWKKSAKKIEADFNKLLEHLKSQDIDIKFQRPKPGESSKEVTVDELNSILKNANQTSTLPAKTHNPDHRSFLNQLTTSTASKD